MKKLFSTILVLGLLLSGNAYAEEKDIIIQCQSDSPKFVHIKPIYIINLETKSAKIGVGSMQVVNYSETEIILGKVNEIYSNIMKFNRLTGRYNSDSIFYGKTKEDEKRITDTGTCIKIKKAF
jgi:hypothetical protein